MRRLCAAMFALTFVAASAWGQAIPNTCDTSKRPRDIPLGYQMRGDRCEGLHWQLVAGEELDVHSLTRSFADFDAAAMPSLSVRWSAPGTGVVHLQVRGYAVDPYSMDALRPAESRHYDWPTNVLSQLGYHRSDIGIVASMPATVGGVQRTIYLPLSIGEAADTGTNASYELVFKAVTTLVEERVIVTPIHADGRSGAPTVTLYKRRLMAEEPARIPVVVSGPAGFYRLDVSAIAADARPLTTPPLIFYHAGTEGAHTHQDQR